MESMEQCSLWLVPLVGALIGSADFADSVDLDRARTSSRVPA
jgi:hypothetical protein